jgi:hypothetical protein
MPRLRSLLALVTAATIAAACTSSPTAPSATAPSHAITRGAVHPTVSAACNGGQTVGSGTC